jgi:hypothetical protein|tara:strand:- start:5965 stop:6417 length:453 start_codon:yes stop_codon:yes gene_type:complete
MTRKEFLIDYEGNLTTTGTNNVEINSIKYVHNGQIRLFGTDQNLEEFIRDLERNPTFRLIKVHDLKQVTAIVDLYETKEVDSLFYIQEERFFDQASQPKAKATISSVVNLIKEGGHDQTDVIRFLSTEGEFRFLVDRQKLRSYIEKNEFK